MGEFFFLRRPVLAMVISLLIVIMGSLALQRLPVAQYPDLVPPTVSVTAIYPGASPEVISQTVAAPLEQAVNGAKDLLYVQSTSSASGVMSMTVTFALGTDPEVASNRVSNLIQTAQAGLPEEVRRLGVSVTSGSGSFLMIITLSSPDGRYDSLFLNNYAALNVIDRLKRVPGVASAASLIAEEYSMRIWFDPAKLAAFGLTPQDIARAIREQNAQYAAGTMGLQPAPDDLKTTWLVSTQGRMATQEEFGDIIVRVDETKGIMRLRDVARIELGAADYGVRSKLNGQPVAGISITLTPGANALQTAQDIRASMEELSRDFPPGVEYAIPYNVTTFVRISIEEVVHTLFEAMILVALVIFIFLQNLRATLIPCIAVPVAIVGTFAGMYALGFSINTLTLFGMVLAIGIVVDDAIVVLENVERIMRDEQLSPREATSKAMREVTGPVIAIVLVLCSVFVPVSFMGGMTGEMFRQFGITIALSVTISGIVALTLTPVMCAWLLRPGHGRERWFTRMFNRIFDGLTSVYLAGVRLLLRFSLLGVVLLCLLGWGMWELFQSVPQGLAPDEDQGYVIAVAMLPEGATMPRTDAALDRLSSTMLKDPSVDAVLTIAGMDLLGGRGTVGNAGAAFVMLRPWEERRTPDQSSSAIAGRIFGIGVTDGMLAAFNPPPIVGLSTVGGLEGFLQNTSGASIEEMAAQAAKLSAAAAARPEFKGVGSGLNLGTPKVFLALDVEKAKLMDVSVADVYQTLSATLAGTYINDFTLYGRAFKVYMQAESRFRTSPEDLESIFVRSRRGAMIPLDNLVSTMPTSGAFALERFNGLPAARISGQAAPGYSNLQAMKALEELVRTELPPGYSLGWSGSSFQEKASGGTNYRALVLGLGLVFLILAAQYESWTLPAAVILAVPFALFGALVTIFAVGYANDIYVQVAMVTLIGLAAKNAILIVEFAAAQCAAGRSPAQAALEAAQLRFRPIVMTSLAFILGCVPLVISSGAGSGSRHVLGSSVIGGMIAATVISPLFVPWFFKVVMSWKRSTATGAEQKNTS
ncbi:efflux RND transporter permease subunit [Desulfoplanes formicivorans]|uniref:RND transporter n=1 Tax=Desulfoplanes formicivorans TaxID=1592317 RepID=A0A194AHR8_9BACT|nr:multidrug efflux RND transporter permease subunit [Desulfoplanes formicivorans]GAU08621.1 RND transporter [Desulfoplanes formicivorans]